MTTKKIVIFILISALSFVNSLTYCTSEKKIIQVANGLQVVNFCTG